jgi:serine/threonine protein kinase
MEYKALSPGTTLKTRFRIEHELGCGSFGRTYLACDQDKFDMKCTIKQLRLEDDRDEQILGKLFHREARQLFLLGKHESIPEFLGYFIENDCHYLAYEYIDGDNLASQIKERQPWSPMEISVLWSKMRLALDYIHGLGLVHRDVKPSNIIRRTQGQGYALIDFGASVLQPSEHGTLIGTPGYAPLCQLAQGIAGPESDFHALAMTVIHLLTGDSPSRLFSLYGPDLRGSWKESIKVADMDKLLIHDIDQGLIDQLSSNTFHSRTTAIQLAVDKTILSPVKDLSALASPKTEPLEDGNRTVTCDVELSTSQEDNISHSHHDQDILNMETTLCQPNEWTIESLNSPNSIPKQSEAYLHEPIQTSQTNDHSNEIASDLNESSQILPHISSKPVNQNHLMANGGVDMTILRSHLFIVYGPIVDLLLEAQTSLIDPEQLASLKENLVDAGLAREVVDKAFQLAFVTLTDYAVDSGSGLENLLPATTIVSTPSGTSCGVLDSDDPQAKLILRQVVGPIADLIWSPEIAKAFRDDSLQLRNLLLDASIPVILVDEIISQLSRCQPPIEQEKIKSIRVEPNKNESQAQPILKQFGNKKNQFTDGLEMRDILIRTVGPIGEMIWDQVSHLPAEELPQALLTLLQGYGLSGHLLDEIRSKFISN